MPFSRAHERMVSISGEWRRREFLIYLTFKSKSIGRLLGRQFFPVSLGFDSFDPSVFSFSRSLLYYPEDVEGRAHTISSMDSLESKFLETL